MIIVSNTTPISELAKIDRLDLFPYLFSEVLIPPEVYTELTSGNHPARTAVSNATWLITQSLTHPATIEQLLQTP